MSATVIGLIGKGFYLRKSLSTFNSFGLNKSFLSSTNRLKNAKWSLDFGNSNWNASKLRTITTSKSNFVKIYTKTGDKGTSSLFNGERRSKVDPTFESLGTVDELNSFVGLARQYSTIPSLLDQLETIQRTLLDIGSSIATPPNNSSSAHLARTHLDEEIVSELEQWIDSMESQLPPLTNFILPSGGQCAATLHVCRSVCRRAERTTVKLREENSVDEVVIKYLNRLSDYFFVAARFSSKMENKTETIYKRRRQKQSNTTTTTTTTTTDQNQTAETTKQ